MTQLSKEKLEEIKYRAETQGINAGYLPDEILAMVNRLLASEAQEPAGIVRYVDMPGGRTGIHVSLYENNLPEGTELYAAPQPVAVPVCPKCGDTGMSDSGGVQPWGEPIEIPCDCRAAMLNAEPVSQPYTLPSELLAAMEEVLRISDRDHEAWHRARDGIAAYRAGMLQRSSGALQLPVAWVVSFSLHGTPVSDFTATFWSLAEKNHWVSLHESAGFSVDVEPLYTAPLEPTK